MQSENAPDRRKLASVFGWTGIAKLVAQGLSFVTMLVLVRLLDKSDFGLFSIVLVYTALVDNVTDFGLQSALIQKKQIDRIAFSSVYWILLCAATIIVGLTYLSIPLVAKFFSNQGVVDTVRLASLAFLMVPSTIVGTAILSRDLQLERIAKIELLACIARCVIAVVCAHSGYGVFSLVYGYLFERLLIGLLLPREAGWHPRMVLNFKSVNALWGFGLNITASRLLWFGYTRIDSIVVGRVLGVDILGVYSIASQMAMAFSQFVSSVYYRVMYPILARAQSSEQFNQTFLKSSIALTLVTLPIMICIGLLAEEIVELFLGDKWREAVPILQVLSVVATCQTLAGLLPQAMNATGRADIGVWINLVSLMLLGVGTFAGAVWGGLEGVLLALLIVTPLRYLGSIASACGVLAIPYDQFVVRHLKPYCAALFLIGAVYVAVLVCGGMSAIWRACIGGVVGAVTYMGVILLLYRDSAVDAVATILESIEKRR